MHQATAKRSQLQVFLAWVVANFIGGCLVGYLEDNGAQFLATLVLSGAIIGSSQWLVLRWMGQRGTRLWPLVSAVGWVVGIFLSFAVPTGSLAAGLWQQLGLWEVFWLNALNQPLWITGMAIAQGAMLSASLPRPMRTLGIWLLASWLGAALHGAVSAWLCRAYCSALPLPLIGVVAGSGWALYAAVTGFALLAISNSSNNTQPLA